MIPQIQRFNTSCLSQLQETETYCTHFQTIPHPFFRNKIPMFETVKFLFRFVRIWMNEFPWLMFLNSVKDKAISCCCCLYDFIAIPCSALQVISWFVFTPLSFFKCIYIYINKQPCVYGKIKHRVGL